MLNKNQYITKLLALLKRERHAILSGDTIGIQNYMVEKENLIQIIKNLREIERDTLNEIQIELHKNRNLLESAVDGLSLVKARLAEMPNTNQESLFYDRNGQTNTLASIHRESSITEKF